MIDYNNFTECLDKFFILWGTSPVMNDRFGKYARLPSTKKLTQQVVAASEALPRLLGAMHADMRLFAGYFFDILDSSKFPDHLNEAMSNLDLVRNRHQTFVLKVLAELKRNKLTLTDNTKDPISDIIDFLNQNPSIDIKSLLFDSEFKPNEGDSSAKIFENYIEHLDNRSTRFMREIIEKMERMDEITVKYLNGGTQTIKSNKGADFDVGALTLDLYALKLGSKGLTDSTIPIGLTEELRNRISIGKAPAEKMERIARKFMIAGVEINFEPSRTKEFFQNTTPEDLNLLMTLDKVIGKGRIGQLYEECTGNRYSGTLKIDNAADAALIIHTFFHRHFADDHRKGIANNLYEKCKIAGSPKEFSDIIKEEIVHGQNKASVKTMVQKLRNEQWLFELLEPYLPVNEIMEARSPTTQGANLFQQNPQISIA